MKPYKYHGCIFNVGPLKNDYFGVHTYSDVLFPFIKELVKQDVKLTWAGIELENHMQNDTLAANGIYQDEVSTLSVQDDVHKMTCSWDFLDANDFDFLLCQPRPETNEIENKILFVLINKFLDAGKPVFVWEQDMFTTYFTPRMRREVILLHPAILPTGKFKREIYFPFFTYEREVADSHERTLDFCFIGNVYFRNAAALQFFGKMNNAPFKKKVYGDWTKDERRAKFSSQFTNFEFDGSTEHWAAIPIMQRTKATLHITPEHAQARGLMTARVFTSQMAKCLCFCDSAIYGAEQFFPVELIVKDGAEIQERWDYVQANREALLAERAELMKEHTVEKRVQQFLKVLKNEVKK